MVRKYRVTVAGHAYEVEVEDLGAGAGAVRSAERVAPQAASARPAAAAQPADSSKALEHAAESAPENCFVANAKAEARNAKVAADKALKLLRHHIADQHLIVPGGKKIGPTSVHCVLSSCEASATVCHHL